MNNILQKIFLLSFMFSPVLLWGQEINDDDSQSELRENAVILENPVVAEHISDYPFLDVASNVINMNGDSWNGLRRRFSKRDSSAFTIVHIGDSHIQADVMSGTVRDNLQKKYGNGGRGLIVPLKIAGTNEPYSYTFTIDQPVMAAKLLSVPWLSDMRFTGVSFTPKTMKYNISLGTEVVRVPDGNPFNRIRLYSRGHFFIDNITDENGIKLMPVVNTKPGYVDIHLPVSVKGVRLSLHSFENVSFSGASITNENSGIVYHTIGNNGAAFSSYNQIDNFGKEVSTLHPDLIIISLGTNEAFGKMSDESLVCEIDHMVKQLKVSNPKAKFLLVTPMECQRASRSYRRARRGKRYSSVKSYSVNARVATIAEVIREYSEKNNIPLYDFYKVAGGAGASAKWVNAKLMSGDRIHLSFPGYRIAGDLFTCAIENELNKPSISQEK